MQKTVIGMEHDCAEKVMALLDEALTCMRGSRVTEHQANEVQIRLNEISMANRAAIIPREIKV